MARKPYLNDEIQGYQDQIIDLKVQRVFLNQGVAEGRQEIEAIGEQIDQLEMLIKSKSRKSFG